MLQYFTYLAYADHLVNLHGPSVKNLCSSTCTKIVTLKNITYYNSGLIFDNCSPLLKGNEICLTLENEGIVIN